jgi:type II secretory pathway component PulF
MKKSEALYKAQLSVLNDQTISFEETLELLAVLMHEEKSAKFSEKLMEERENGNSL